MTTADPEIAQQIAANRARYETLKAAGTGQAPQAMPQLTSLASAAIDPAVVIFSETVPGGWYANYRLKVGERIRIASPAGNSAVALLAWNAADTSERLNHADSIKIQWTAALAKGRLLFSDMGRVLLSIVEDSSGAHDVLAGGLNAASVTRKYGADAALRNTRTNFVLAASKFGLDPRDIPPFVTFFAPVSVAEDGSLGWREGARRAGDFVELRAEMDLLVAISNCPHPLDPSPTYVAGAVEVSTLAALPQDPTDFCRRATSEAVRGFENNDFYRAK
ncbi:urea carboxylase [Devosia sp. Root685]|uniref:urea amidolyase associated protein UAAP1 n=1 Tax=Devosia sp. Root685 TaxID=1736587 RepID=UPI0006FF0562|nr:urea amidolyase associated protein UAAP1 [Devosia sp. Root685]KRA95078.1 urea carboxylase [Devosia sp. Root685]